LLVESELMRLFQVLLHLILVCNTHRLEFLTQLVVVIENSDRNAVAISQVAEWDVFLLTLINRCRPSGLSLLSPPHSNHDDGRIVASMAHRVVAAVARAHLGVTCGWKIVCGCLDLSCRLVAGQPADQPDRSARQTPGLSSINQGASGHLDGLTFVLDVLIRQVHHADIRCVGGLWL
jgi:hypothetical protein